MPPPFLLCSMCIWNTSKTCTFTVVNVRSGEFLVSSRVIEIYSHRHFSLLVLQYLLAFLMNKSNFDLTFTWLYIRFPLKINVSFLNMAGKSNRKDLFIWSGSCLVPTEDPYIYLIWISWCFSVDTIWTTQDLIIWYFKL